MVRSSFDYRQLGIGDCGHVVHTWPQIIKDRKTHVLCIDCTKEKYGIDADAELTVWTTLRPDPPKPMPKVKRTKTQKPEPKPSDPVMALLLEEGVIT